MPLDVMPHAVIADCASPSVIQNEGGATPPQQSEMSQLNQYTVFRAQKMHKQSSLDDDSISPSHITCDQMVPTPPTNIRSRFNSDTPTSTIQEQWPSKHLACASDGHYTLAECNVDQHTKSFLAARCTGELEDPKWVVKIKNKARITLDSTIQSFHSCSASSNLSSHHRFWGPELGCTVPSLQYDHAPDTLALAQSGQESLQPEKCRFHSTSPKKALNKAALSSQRLQVLNSDHARYDVQPRSVNNVLKGLEPAVMSNIRGLYWKAGRKASNPLLHTIEGTENSEATNRQPQRVIEGSIGNEPWLEKAQDGISNNRQESRTRASPDSGRASEGQTKTGQKRRLDSTRWEDDDYDDSGKDGDKSKARKRPRREDSEVKRFACPFYKHNPQEYRSSRTCMGPGWANVHRVKLVLFTSFSYRIDY